MKSIDSPHSVSDHGNNSGIRPGNSSGISSGFLSEIRLFRKYRQIVRYVAASFLLLQILLTDSVSAFASYAYGCICPDSDRVLLTQEDIASMSAQVVSYAENEIYARNGKKFLSSELQNYFSRQYWYRPLYEPEEFTPDMLNEYEAENLLLLEDREQELGEYNLDQENCSYDAVYSYIGNYSISHTDDYEVDPYASIFYDSSFRYLTQDEVEQLNLQELYYARNEIYARNGYIFQSQELQNYFGQKIWYTGYKVPDEFDDRVLNEYEKANIDLLKEQEFSVSVTGYLPDQDGYSYTDIGYYIDYDEAVSRGSIENELIFPDSSIRFLTDDDLEDISAQMLCYARNEIYARSGYIFQSEELREYFTDKSWYQPRMRTEEFTASVFNGFEAENVQLLRNYEYSILPEGYQLN